MKTDPIPQHSAAVALVQLLEEFSDLPRIAWRISDREVLANSLYGAAPTMDDPRPVVAAWAEALGARVKETPFEYDDGPRMEFAVVTVWRDVRVEIRTSCLVSALAGTAQVAA